MRQQQPGHQSRTGMNPITNTPYSYTVPNQQLQANQAIYKPQYPPQQQNQQYTQKPQTSEGFNNTYYNQTLPKNMQEQQAKGVNTQQRVQAVSQLDAIELDHLNGYSGRYGNTIHLHPTSQNTIVYSIAGLVVIENLNDRHQQSFLRGHDMDVTALAVSKSGRYIASGQLGTKHAKNSEAPIILWDYESQKPRQVFRGLRDAITNLSFSDDEKFLAATCEQYYHHFNNLLALNNSMTIWNCEDYSLVHNKVLEVPFNLITWCPPRRSSSKHSQYLLITSQGPNIFINTLEFDIASMQYTLKQATCQLPSTGLIRQYTKAAIDQTGDYLYVGTTAGEGGIFKAAVPISNNGVLDLRLFGKQLFLACGDGKVKKLVGQETKWSFEREVILEGRMNSITIDSQGRELLVGGSLGKIYRLIAQTLDCTIHCEGHLQSIVGLSLPKESNDIFATIDTDGFVLVWDLNDMLVITRCMPATMNRVRGSSVWIDPEQTVISGWKDGFIRCYQIGNNKGISAQKWEIVNAHKGSVSSLYSDRNYYLSGGEDGIVRLWSRSARQLITQISIHTKEITKIFPDLEKSHYIHSCSVDKTIHTYDLKTDRKVILHQAKNGILLDMTQRKDSELELNSFLHLSILFYLFDYNNAYFQQLVE